MKGQNNQRIFTIGLAVLILAVFVWLNSSNKGFQWYETLNPEGKQPYDLDLVQELLTVQVGSSNYSSESERFLFTELPENSTVVFIGAVFHATSNEITDFSTWISEGNTAFLSVYSLPEELLPLVYDSLVCGDFKGGNTYQLVDSAARFSLLNSDFQGKNAVEFEVAYKEDTHQSYDFRCFDARQFCEGSSYTALGFTRDIFPNFISIRHGKGQILVHCSPVAFTNYQITFYRRAAYLRAVFSYLPKGKIIWDDYHRYFHDYKGQQQKQAESPLNFILGQQGLRWSFYLLLLLALIYVITAFRRTQQVIPIVEPLRNSTLGFVKASGRLYYLQRNHPVLIQMQIKYFRIFIRENYRIRSTEVSTIPVDQLSAVSGVSAELIEKIIQEYVRLSMYSLLSDKETIQFSELLNQFYKSRKR